MSTVGYPGDKCTTGSDCSTNYCVSGKCAGAAKGASCETYGCGYGLQCDVTSGFTCKAQIAAGSTGCYSDLSCVNNAGCNKTTTSLTGECLDYFSVEEGKTVACDNIAGYDVNFLCASGAAVSSHAATGTCTCIKAPKSVNPPPFKCTSS